MKHTRKQRITRALASTLVFCLLAPNAATLAFATTAPEKEEVVYALLHHGGQLKSAYIVNIFTQEGPGAIVDYGDYAAVTNLTTQEPVLQSGDEITIDTRAEKLYYQGTPNHIELPWTVSVRYTLDGQTMPAEELAGKTGALSIYIDISENSAAPEGFFDSCALQVGLTLNATTCTNIRAEGATFANAGKNKQLTFTALPGKGLHTIVSAQVTDFEMERISINGIGMALNFDVDTAEFSDGFTDLQDAIADLNEGAGDLRSAVKKVYNGSGELMDGVLQLRDGTVEFDDGIKKLIDGIYELQNGMGEIVYNARKLDDGFQELSSGAAGLVDGSAQINSALIQMRDGISGQMGGISALLPQLSGLGALFTNAATLQRQNAGLARSLDNYLIHSRSTLPPEVIPLITGAVQLLEQNATAFEGMADAAPAFDTTSITQMVNGLSSLSGGLVTLCDNYGQFHAGLRKFAGGLDEAADGYSQLFDGLEEYFGGIAKFSHEAAKLRDGSSELADGTQELYDGIAQFRDGIRKLYDGMGEFTDGTQEFYDETRDMDSEIGDKIDDMIDELSGSAVPPRSFASEKNTNVRSVQFVMAIDAIEKPKAEKAPGEQAQTETFWTRLKKLFRG